MKLPSMSKLSLVFKCPAAGVLPADNTVTEASEKGSAIHEYLARVMMGVDPALAIAHVPEQWREEARAIDLDDVPRLKPGTVRVELAFALDPVKRTARVLGENIGREAAYADLRPGEIPGTADLVGVVDGGEHDGKLYVGDWKTGWARDVPAARENWQLRALACAAALALPLDPLCPEALKDAAFGDVLVSIIRTQGSVRHDEHLLEALDLELALDELAGLVGSQERLQARQWQVGDVRQGDHCRNCPSFSHCPAKRGLMDRLVREPEALVNDTTRLMLKDPKEAYRVYRDLKAFVHRLDQAFRAFAETRPIELDGGKVFGARETETLEFDGYITFHAMREHFGEEAALAACEMTTSKAGIARGISRKALKGQKAKLVREMIAEVEKRGGVKRKRGKRVEEHTPNGVEVSDDNNEEAA